MNDKEHVRVTTRELHGFHFSLEDQKNSMNELLLKVYTVIFLQVVTLILSVAGFIVLYLLRGVS